MYRAMCRATDLTDLVSPCCLVSSAISSFWDTWTSKFPRLVCMTSMPWPLPDAANRILTTTLNHGKKNRIRLLNSRLGTDQVLTVLGSGTETYRSSQITHSCQRVRRHAVRVAKGYTRDTRFLRSPFHTRHSRRLSRASRRRRGRLSYWAFRPYAAGLTGVPTGALRPSRTKLASRR
jgi:hypothetical protein